MILFELNNWRLCAKAKAHQKLMLKTQFYIVDIQKIWWLLSIKDVLFLFVYIFHKTQNNIIDDYSRQWRRKLFFFSIYYYHTVLKNWRDLEH